MNESTKDWGISDEEIESTEKLLLSEGAHFLNDAREVIRCWESTDVLACPGSGKTTVLLAKLKLLADRMPFEDGSGICVLSHTNVAVNEIKEKLPAYNDKLLNYPNYIGTIQSFVDKFITLPYLNNLTGRLVQPVEDIIYAKHIYYKMKMDYRFKEFRYFIENKRDFNNENEKINYIKNIYLGKNGDLFLKKQKNKLAGKESNSAMQYSLIILELLNKEGIITYEQAYSCANKFLNNISQEWIQLFTARFKYVFIDEYQDCDVVQQIIIDRIFNSSKTTIMKIGDKDQAIYNSHESDTGELKWNPKDNKLQMLGSCRYSQEIANLISHLRTDNEKIISIKGEVGIKPVLLVFDPDKIEKVIEAFINEMDKIKLINPNGIYKAIGFIKKKGKKDNLIIESYWRKYNPSNNIKSEFNYWYLINEILEELSQGKLYKAEKIVRIIVCRNLHYLGVKNQKTNKDFTTNSIKKFFDENYNDQYREWIYGLSRIENLDFLSADTIITQNMENLLETINVSKKYSEFRKIHHFFNDKNNLFNPENNKENIYLDTEKGRRIEFSTIHAVKGETHDATLYLETYYKNSTDLSRILPFFNFTNKKNNAIEEYSRKLAYVGMSRPKKLLCVAMQSDTYNKCKDEIGNYLKVVDIR
ncbi:UvrD-helicase domain-containing protein [Peptoniphilus harei]|uniref:ATP-dependent helicase n=1 Tax=Peptoniphilus harei TaxID=54005 RepID=A0A943SQA1_9FIRM|nr:UvrD-helicase domain-containing protein [Peptoniphilus harei]MBS6534882.1 ATP-dependent helicase [Peptoniphilus harei]